MNTSGDLPVLPFACALCSDKFAKKLQLSAHIESRHGVKYVFTERGKKVKLVRMPEVVNEGDKLDPFVEMLMKKAAVGHQDPKNSILVHSVEAFTGLAEELNPEDLLRNELGSDICCGILVDNINTNAYEVAESKGEPPFVALSSFYSQDAFLLRIVQLNEKKQILVPATISDLKKTKVAEVGPKSPQSETNNLNLKKELAESYMEVSQVESGGHKEMKIERADDNTETGLEHEFSNVAVVAYAGVVLDEEKRQFQVVIEPPVKDKLQSLKLISYEDFKDMTLLCKPKRLRCLSEAYTSVAETKEPETAVASSGKPKRKYTRRTYGKENKVVDEIPGPVLSEMPNEVMEKSLKEEKKNEDSDDEEKDATYTPAMEKAKPGPRRRGRPRKLSRTSM